MRFVDKSCWLWRFFISITIVDLFVRKESGEGEVYPVFCIDILKPKSRGVGISITIPIAKLSIGFR